MQDRKLRSRRQIQPKQVSLSDTSSDAGQTSDSTQRSDSSSTTVLIFGGGAVLAVLCVSAILIYRHYEGKTVDRAYEAPVDLKTTAVTEVSSQQPVAVVPNGVWQEWPADAPRPAIAPFNSVDAKQRQKEWADYLNIDVEFTNALGMKFRLIPPGEYLMGSTQAEIEAVKKIAGDDLNVLNGIASEVPQHRIILSRPLYVSNTEVTQQQYEKVTGRTPSHFSKTGDGKSVVSGLDTGNFPVESVTWNEAVEFCSKLNLKDKLKPFLFPEGYTPLPLEKRVYRLPTEAEWEFACRAGTMSKYWFGGDDQESALAMWRQSNSSARTHSVGELKSNPFGLVDVHGNVEEWVQDAWLPTFYDQSAGRAAIDPVCVSNSSAGTQRVCRGGSWDGSEAVCRAASRSYYHPTSRAKEIGFRVVVVAGSPRVVRR